MQRLYSIEKGQQVFFELKEAHHNIPSESPIGSEIRKNKKIMGK